MSDDTKLTPFDFIRSVTDSKKNLIAEADDPVETERQYVPYVVNKGLSFNADTILHAMEMNTRHDLPKGAQYLYYLGALRQGRRYGKWMKTEASDTLDKIQQRYQCNRVVAKQYLKVMTAEHIETLNKVMSTGGT